jgi:hypothetical protein
MELKEAQVSTSDSSKVFNKSLISVTLFLCAMERGYISNAPEAG